MTSNEIVEESLKTRKAREKLKRQLEAMDQVITPQALEKKTAEMHRWIERHAAHRVSLKSKGFSLFDENQNAAPLSERVSILADELSRKTQDQMGKLKAFMELEKKGESG
ncbi:MAG: hypothetical protein JSS61_05630 [Verrucomicrobia bacterium]|nr:hypothetical protein [Verrucomicrobiota bacterium]